MLILGIETAGSTASAALLQDGALIAEHSVHHTRTHSETVMPMAERMLTDLGFSPSQLGAIAVNCGPGSFTGVRIGVCAANAMGAALSIPVVGVDALRALYENISFWPGNVCAIIDAKNDNAYFAQYAGGVAVAEPAAEEAAAYLPSVPPGTLFVGDGAAAYEALILKAVPNAKFAPEYAALSRASALCRVAERILKEAGEPLKEALPLYLRPSQAERMWQKLHGAAEPS
ncbi:MAG TPA: tRNA (adenosine(37)-N6)-threonylcarbamoyltransferase complex dimerization subunit type 1 TsaB [Feifaniaceae bacterium]|nr:tRNA (adenosine(37)-N6)-threonylcarbamoyltransferase complex dimerization subunit type 1 TsaB [Feifaniaceae bacterium]